jgi:hypothetical protein
VIEVRVGQEDMVDERQFGKRQIGDTRPGIDEQSCRRASRWFADGAANASATAENPDFHAGSRIHLLPGLPRPDRRRRAVGLARRERRFPSGLQKEFHLHPGNLDQVMVLQTMRLGVNSRPFSTGKLAPSTWVRK